MNNFTGSLREGLFRKIVKRPFDIYLIVFKHFSGLEFPLESMFFQFKTGSTILLKRVFGVLNLQPDS